VGFVPIINRAQERKEGLGRGRPQPTGVGRVAVRRQLGDAPLHHRPGSVHHLGRHLSLDHQSGGVGVIDSIGGRMVIASL